MVTFTAVQAKLSNMSLGWVTTEIKYLKSRVYILYHGLRILHVKKKKEKKKKGKRMHNVIAMMRSFFH